MFHAARATSPTLTPAKRRPTMKLHTTAGPTVLLLALVTVALSGCNTIEGAGEDIERAGEEIEDAARS
jgi:predicted small secreted protein